MTPAARLQVVLLALLPGDGSAIAANQLAAASCAQHHDVKNALAEAVLAGQVRFDALANTYAAVKQGGAL